MSSLQIANLTATIVWARFTYRYLTAARGMPHVDDCLPFVVNLQQIATQRDIDSPSSRDDHYQIKWPAGRMVMVACTANTITDY